MRIKLLTVLFVAFLALLSVLASQDEPVPVMRALARIPELDKLGHAVLAFIFAHLLSALTGYRRLHGWLLGCLLVAGISIADECAQVWIPNRSASLIDFICDLSGVLVAQVSLRNRPAASREPAEH